jgi:GT2 family glycosyltransferase
VSEATDGDEGRPSDAGLRVTVLVPSYKRPRNAVTCLDGIMRLTRPADEIVMVARDEDLETREAIEGWRRRSGAFGDRLRLAIATKPGQIPAMNAGLALATGDIVCFTDDDCVPRPDWLERLLRHYADPTVGGVGGRDVIHYGDEVLEAEVTVVGRYTWFGRPVGNHHLRLVPLEPADCDILKGANMSFRRALLAHAFDEALQLGAAQCNDADASLRVRRRGYRLIYDPLAVVDHYPSERFGKATRRYDASHMLFAEGHNWMYIALKHARPWEVPGVLAYGFLVGHARAYGLLRAATALREAPPLLVARRLGHSLRGKSAAIFTALRGGRGSP